MSSQTMTLNIEANAAGAGAATNKLGGAAKPVQTLSSAIRGMGEAAQTSNLHLNRSKTQIVGLQFAANTITGAFQRLGQQWRDALNVTLKLEAAQRILNHSVEDGGAAFEWVKEKALKYGLAVSDLAHEYGLFMAATKNARISTAEAQKVFESFSVAASALGLTADKANLIFYALREGFSKGKVYSADFIRQIGTHLPGAVGRGAKAMGMLEGEFLKAMGQGKIMADELYPKLAKVLMEELAPAAEEASGALQGSMNKMRDSFELFYLEVAKGGASKGLAKLANDMHLLFRDPKMLAEGRALGEQIASLAKKFGVLTRIGIEWRNVLISLAGAMVLTKVVKYIDKLNDWRKTKVLLIKDTYKETMATNLNATAITKEAVAREQSAKAMLKERLFWNQLLLDRIKAQNANGALMTQARAQKTMHLETAILLDKQKLSTIGLTKATVGLKSAMAALGGPIGVLTVLITAAAAAWGFYKKKHNEALAAIEQTRITNDERSKDIKDFSQSIYQQTLALAELKEGTSEYNTVLAGLRKTYADLNEKDPTLVRGLKLNFDDTKSLAEQAIKLHLATKKELSDREATYKKDYDDAKKQLEKGKSDTYARLRRNARDEETAKMLTADKYKDEEKYVNELKVAWEKTAAAVVSYQAAIDGIEHGADRTPTAADDGKGISSGTKSIITELEHKQRMLQYSADELATLKKVSHWKKFNHDLAQIQANLEKKRQDIQEKAFENEKDKKAEIDAAEKVAAAQRTAAIRDFYEKANADDAARREAEQKLMDHIEAHEAEGLERRLVKIQQHTAKAIEEYTKEMLAKGMPVDQKLIKRTEQAGEAQQQAAKDEDREKKKEAHLRLVQHYQSEINKQAVHIAKANGVAFKWDYQNIFDKLEKEAAEIEKTFPEKAAAIRESIRLIKEEIHFDANAWDGIKTGWREALKECESNYELFRSGMKTMALDLQSTMAGSMQDIFTKGMAGADKWNRAWDSLRASMVSNITQIAAKKLVWVATNKLLDKSEQQTTQITIMTLQQKLAAMSAEVAALKIKVAATVEANAEETTSDVTSTTAKYMKAYAALPWIGTGLAIASIAVMMAQMRKAQATKFATGGLVTKPTLALIGETGKREFVAPEIDFINWSERLSYNIIRRQNEANKYAEYNAMIIRQASEGGMRPPVTVNHYAIEDSRKAGAALNKLLNHYAAGV